MNAIQRDCHMLYRNEMGGGSESGFIKVRLRASKGDPDAVGAIVKMTLGDRQQAQVLACGSGFESQNAPELIFGTGAAPGAGLRVRWPGRAEEDFGTAATGGRYLLREGSGKLESYPARTITLRDSGPRGVRIAVGDKIGPLGLRTLEGVAAAVAASEKPLLINFWATYCVSCQRELPLLQRLHESGRYRVIGVSLDSPEQAPRVRALWESGRLGFECFLIDDQTAGRLFDLALLSIPVTIAVDPNGTVTRIVQGQLADGSF